MNIVWRESLWLLLAFYPALLAVWQRFYRHRYTQHYAEPALLPWAQAGTRHWQHHLRSIFWFVFWVLLAITLAGPRSALQNPNQQTNAKQDIVVLIDVSRSMQVSDISPNRLQRAGLELHEFLQQSQNNRIAVIVYAARPHLLVPFTVDKSAVAFYLQYLDSLVLPTLGSDANAALNFALDSITQRSNTTLPAAVLWLTDGDIPKSHQTLLKKQLEQLQSHSISLNILGIGTEDGDAIPLADGTWLEHEGHVIRSRLNSDLLQQLAEQGNGQYSIVKDDSSDWQVLYNEGIAQAVAITNPNNQKDPQWQELYLWSLLPALFLLFFLVNLPKTILPVFLLLYLPIPQPTHADSLALDKGIQAYQEENYKTAIKQFSSAVFKANTDDERGRALHNLGNSYFQQGDYTAAIQVFHDALTYRPKHASTTQNLALGKTIQLELEKRLATRASQLGNNNESGSRLERWSNELDWDQETTRTWGESKNKAAGKNISIPLDTKILDRLVNRGFQRLADNGANTLQEWNQKQQSLHDAQTALQQMDSNPTNLFKRLFEVEEGFYSKQSKPQILLGVLPW